MAYLDFAYGPCLISEHSGLLLLIYTTQVGTGLLVAHLLRECC